jgi:hypothetical protein
LDAIRIRAFENVDRSLLSQIAYPGSPFEKEALKELNALDRDDVLARMKIFDNSVRVMSLEPDRAKLRQEVVRRIRFFTAEGEEVTGLKHPVRRVTYWTLARDRKGRWLIYRLLTVSSVEVKRGGDVR